MISDLDMFNVVGVLAFSVLPVCGYFALMPPQKRRTDVVNMHERVEPFAPIRYEDFHRPPQDVFAHPLAAAMLIFTRAWERRPTACDERW
jgi:hypothetical protein